jgi:hypothetical protein
MPPTLSDLAWIMFKMVAILLAIDLGLMYVIWRARGIYRAQEHRRRKRKFRRRQIENSIWVAQSHIANSNAETREMERAIR